jgi:DnaD/phage-associated family protein
MAGTTDKNPYPWIKLYTEFLHDPALAELSLASVGLYLELYLMAGRCDAGGALQSDTNNYTLKDIAWILRQDEGIIGNAIRELRNAGLVHDEDDCLIITRFMSEQGPGALDKREYWAEKQREHRLKTKDLKTKDIKTKDLRHKTKTKTESMTSLTMSMTQDENQKTAAEAEVQPIKIIEHIFGAEFKYKMPASVRKEINDIHLQKGIEVDLICDAIREAGIQGALKWSYARAILNRWIEQGGKNNGKNVKASSSGNSNSAIQARNYETLENWSNQHD